MDEKVYTLRDMRELSNLPIKEIVAQSGVTYKSIRNWETGQHVPSLINTQELLKVYGFSISQLNMSPFYEK